MAKKAKVFQFKLLPMDFSRLVLSPLLLLFRLKRRKADGQPYKEKISGGALIAANHTSMLDPFLVCCTFWYRRVFYLAAEAVMGGKIRSFLLKQAGAVKIDRNIADIEAIRNSVGILKDGRILTMFPQGKITKEENLNTLKSGAVLIALQAGVPIIPMRILPKEKWYSRRKVIIGNTIDPKTVLSRPFPTTADIEHITHLLTEEMERLS